eukprot:3939201-Rhodomonas_salina.2
MHHPQDPTSACIIEQIKDAFKCISQQIQHVSSNRSDMQHTRHRSDRIVSNMSPTRNLAARHSFAPRFVPHRGLPR